MRIISLDPAGGLFGVAGLQMDTDDSGQQKLTLYASHLLAAPEHFNSSQKTIYMSHCIAALISADQPDRVVSENPWGAGFSKTTLTQLIGAIKAETWRDIEWQGVSEARRAVLGDGYGGATKRVSAEWMLQYPWNISSKREIQRLFDAASPDKDDGYDILDAILHGLCYLIVNSGLKPVHKEPKAKAKKKKGG